MFGEHKQSSRKSVYSQDYNFEFNWLARKEGPKVFLMMRKVNPSRPLGKWGLHPLIHTLLGFASAQDLEKKKTEPKTPHFLSLNQDIVVCS